MTESERDRHDRHLHRVIDNYLTMFATQFGLERTDALDRVECFIELEREEMAEARARAAMREEAEHA